LCPHLVKAPQQFVPLGGGVEILDAAAEVLPNGTMFSGGAQSMQSALRMACFSAADAPERSRDFSAWICSLLHILETLDAPS
jgi:hypothetical protein